MMSTVVRNSTMLHLPSGNRLKYRVPQQYPHLERSVDPVGDEIHALNERRNEEIHRLTPGWRETLGIERPKRGGHGLELHAQTMELPKAIYFREPLEVWADIPHHGELRGHEEPCRSGRLQEVIEDLPRLGMEPRAQEANGDDDGSYGSLVMRREDVPRHRVFRMGLEIAEERMTGGPVAFNPDDECVHTHSG